MHRRTVTSTTRSAAGLRPRPRSCARPHRADPRRFRPNARRPAHRSVRPSGGLEARDPYGCQTSALWPDHRARLLQALIDHDAFASLRHDVAWKIIDLTFDVPRPPRVLRECAALAVEQVDFSAIAYTWLASNRDKAAARSSEPCLSYLDMSGVHRDVHLQQEMAPELPGGLVSAMPALDSAPPRAALPAGSARPATTVQADTAAATRRQSARRTHARTRRVPPGPRTDRRKAAHRRPSAITARKAPRTAAPSSRRLAVTLTVGAAVIATAIVLFLGVLQLAISSGLRTAIPSAQQEPLGSINRLPVIASAPRHDVAVALPFVLLFASNSAVLQPGANAVLHLPIVYQARSEHLAVSITGYASPERGYRCLQPCLVGPARERRPRPTNRARGSCYPDNPCHRCWHRWMVIKCRQRRQARRSHVRRSTSRSYSSITCEEGSMNSFNWEASAISCRVEACR